MAKYFLFFTLLVSFTASAQSGDWVSNGLQAASSAVAGNPSGGDCVPGAQEATERSDYIPYEQTEQHSTQCNGGESWAECSRRLFLGR